MSQRVSGYARMPKETYVTPRWVYEALYTVEPWATGAWDCAPVNADFDYLKDDPHKFDCLDIATNPPFSLASEFCRQAVQRSCKVAMLLPISFDCAKTRHDLFSDNNCFKAKYILTRRIRWENLEQKTAGPSQNHSWYVWDTSHVGPPVIGWLP